MTLLDTIPIYTTPAWFIILMIIAGGLLVGMCIYGEGETVELIIIIICALILLTGIILSICGVPKIYSHDEYVIELNESTSATEFFKNYEITKTFDYSNAWQVKKKDGTK